MDYYDILGVPRGASFNSIKKAYKKLIQEWHPDKFPHDASMQSEAENKAKKINEAWAYFWYRWKKEGNRGFPKKPNTASRQSDRQETRSGQEIINDAFSGVVRALKRKGLSQDIAQRRVLERVTDIQNEILLALDYAPHAIVGIQLEERLISRRVNITDDLMTLAVSALVRARKIQEINGWYTKCIDMPDPEKFTCDDWGWMTGTGQYAQ